MQTVEASVLRQVAAYSLFAFDVGYDRLSDHVFVWHGDRPAGGWHVHGWTDAHPWSVVDGRRQRLTIRKRRWRRADRTATCHSHPPDALRVYSDALLVALELWCWLDAAVGLHRYVGPFDEGPARRTVQRWLRRALPVAAATQHALRHAIIERSEPRPVEMLFPRGLAPPADLQRRRWRVPSSVSTLWRGLAILIIGASKLQISCAPLLAEARRRSTAPPEQFLLL